MKDPFIIQTGGQLSKKRGYLEFEESAADTVKNVDDVHDTERGAQEFVFIRILLLAAFVVLCGRLAYLQIVRGAYFREVSENNRVRSQVVEAPRGLFLDTTGRPLLENIAGFNLVAVPFDLPKGDLRSPVLKLAETLKLDPETILEKLKNFNRNSIIPVVVFQDLPSETAILFQTRATEFAGFSVEKTPIRHYFDPKVFSAVLGYTSLADLDDIKTFNLGDEAIGSQVGKQGLEVEFESLLRGSPGQNQVEVDAAGKLLKVMGEKAAVPGNTLELNIDADLQKVIYDELTKNNPNVKAAAVALNPKTGEVLSLLSLPGFDNNLFAHGISNADFQKLLNDPLKPLINRAVAGQYPPGSTVKPMVAAAALNEGVVTEHTVIMDRGVLVVPHQFDPNISYDFVGWKRSGLGPMDARSAIAQSSDIYFYTVAGGHPSSRIAGLGAEKLAEYYRKFHLGQVTGIDVPGEKTGVVADPEWKARAFAGDAILKKWYLGDTYHIGIGQGDMLATPLQVAEWTSVIANNGTGMKPRLLKKVISPDGREISRTEPSVLVEKFLPDDILKIVQEGMRMTVTSGSGRQLNTLPVSSAGKTGTSQFDGSDPTRTHAWFTAYAPFEDPQIVVVVLVEAGGEGHAAAVPVVRQALEWWAKNRFSK